MPQLFAELSRRNVLRVAVAYLALAWLLLQVIDTITALISLPTWVGPYALVAVAIGFPIAAFLAWAYELTPEGIRATDERDDDQPITRFGGRKIDFVIIGALSLVIVLLLIKDSIVPPVAPDDGRPPPVSNYTQLTRTRIILPPAPSPYPVIADAQRLYFSDFSKGRITAMQVSRSGGEAVPFSTAKVDADLEFRPQTLSPDGSSLVMFGFRPNSFTREPNIGLWQFPLVGGTPRYLGYGGDATFSPDGERIAYADIDANIFIAKPDLSEPRKLTEALPRPHWIRFSPDGQRIRYTLMGQTKSIWEIPVDGGEPQPLFPDWRTVDHCCGNWTPDGSFFVFQAELDYRTQLWARSENDDHTTEPVQITASALDFRRPTIADEGRKIYAVSWQLRGEVVRYDTQVDTFVPLPGFESVSGELFSYSGDGELVAYISYPQADLWRSNSDGSDRRQLTFPPMRVWYGVWSPDNRYIAFIGQLPNEPRQIYLLPADGGLPQPLTDDEREVLAPSWFPDSRQILVYMDTKEQLQVYDIDDGTFTPMPGTEGLRGPDLSPDGTRFMAFSPEGIVVQNTLSGERDILIPRGESRVEMTIWDKDGEHIFVVDSSMKGAERSVRRMNIDDKSTETVAVVGNTLSVWGVFGMWIGVDPDGAPIMLKDNSIHHIYALDWLPEQAATP